MFHNFRLLDSLPSALKTVDDFSDKDVKAAAAFKMLEYVSLEHSKLLLGSVSVLLQCALLYYRSPATICNILQSIQRSGNACPPSVSKLIDLLPGLDLSSGLTNETTVKKREECVDFFFLKIFFSF